MNRKRIRGIASLGAVVLLVACQHSPDPPIPQPPQQVETGSRFTLGTPLSFPAGSSELFFQNEQVVAAAKLSREMPLCKLVPESGARGAIPPGTFTVGSVNYDEREVGTTSGMTSVTRIALTADSGQQGYTLSCGWPPGASSRGFVTTEQIYNAIGGKYFTMNLLR